MDEFNTCELMKWKVNSVHTGGTGTQLPQVLSVVKNEVTLECSSMRERIAKAKNVAWDVNLS